MQDKLTGYYKATDTVSVFVERKSNMINYQVTYSDMGRSSTITMTEGDIRDALEKGRMWRVA